MHLIEEIRAGGVMCSLKSFLTKVDKLDDGKVSERHLINVWSNGSTTYIVNSPLYSKHIMLSGIHKIHSPAGCAEPLIVTLQLHLYFPTVLL